MFACRKEVFFHQQLMKVVFIGGTSNLGSTPNPLPTYQQERSAGGAQTPPRSSFRRWGGRPGCSRGFYRYCI